MAIRLTFEERGFLYRMNKEGKSKTEISRSMERDRSTVNREVARVERLIDERPHTTRLSNSGRNPRTKTLSQSILDTTKMKQSLSWN